MESQTDSLEAKIDSREVRLNADSLAYKAHTMECAMHAYRAWLNDLLATLRLSRNREELSKVDTEGVLYEQVDRTWEKACEQNRKLGLP